MKKKLRKELNNYLEKDGFKIDKIIGDRFTTDCKYWELVFTIKKNPKHPKKEQLLEKAKMWMIDIEDNYKLKIADRYNYSGDEPVFTTKKEALNYVLEEAKERFNDNGLYYDRNEYSDSDFYWILGINGNVWDSSQGWTAEPIKEPKLMLGNYKVDIVPSYGNNYQTNTYDELTLIKCNGGQVTKEEWMEWYNNYKSVLNYTGEIMFNLGNYHIYVNDMNFYINSTDVSISHITIEQIQAITDRLNEV